MEYPAAAAIHRCGIRSEAHQRADRRSEQPGILLSVRRPRYQGLRNRAEWLPDRGLAVLAGLRLHRCPDHAATSTTIVPGNRVQLVPFNQFSWWNKYQFTPVWAASVGVIYFSDSFASSDDSVRLPGFVRFDAGLFAKINETWKAQLNIENIFNKGYWASADANNNISPGSPRAVRLTAIANW